MKIKHYILIGIALIIESVFLYILSKFI